MFRITPSLPVRSRFTRGIPMGSRSSCAAAPGAGLLVAAVQSAIRLGFERRV
jgi:hypothetical protein